MIESGRMEKIYIGFSTFPDQSSAREFAEMVVKQGLAKCVSILPGVESLYLWEGKLCEESEVMLLIKLREREKEHFKIALYSHHPYDVPELIFSEIDDGNKTYLQWLRGELQE